jgi:hypothetical protein
MNVADRFAPYGAVDAGICVIEFETSSTVIYCNALFASLLSARPDELEGRSLDELSKAHQLIYDLAGPIAANANKVALAGGFCFPMFDQVAKGMVRTLRVFRVDMEIFGNKVYLIGYARKATRFEIWLHRTRLDTNLDPYWKPIASFLLSGHWRPWLTAASPIWLPYLISVSPEWADFIDKLFNEIK